jgi:hypothetical protein
MIRLSFTGWRHQRYREEAILREYEHLAETWAAQRLWLEDRETLHEQALRNLEWSAQQPGFHYFLVQLNERSGSAKVICFGDTIGTSVAVWLSKEGLHLCGNKYFQER